jgi:hypothetical protein
MGYCRGKMSSRKCIKRVVSCTEMEKVDSDTNWSTF